MGLPLLLSSKDDSEVSPGSTSRWKRMSWWWKWNHKANKIMFATITIMCLLSFPCALYFGNVNSKLNIHWAECHEQLQNQTTQVQDTVNALEVCTKTLGKICDKTKDSHDLRVQLVTANQNLNKTYQRWGSCQKELNTLNNSIRIQTKQQEAEKHKLQGCQAQLQNQTAQMQAQAAVKKSTEELKKDLDVAKKVGDDLNAQLVDANQNLGKTQQRWDACQKELNTLNNNIRIQSKQQEAEKHKLQEQIASLQQDLHDQAQELSKMKKKMQLQPSKSEGARAVIPVLCITLLLPILALLFRAACHLVAS